MRKIISVFLSFVVCVGTDCRAQRKSSGVKLYSKKISLSKFNRKKYINNLSIKNKILNIGKHNKETPILYDQRYADYENVQTFNKRKKIQKYYRRNDFSKLIIFGTSATILISITIILIILFSYDSQNVISTTHKDDKNENVTQKSVDRFNEWLRWLMGENVGEGVFRYSCIEKLISDINKNLEDFHDFIQLFPNFLPGAYNSHDLYINKHLDEWKQIISDDNKREKIQKTLRKFLIRMLEFWKFKVITDKNDNSKITSLSLDDPSSQPFQSGDHNNARMTRILIGLKIFGLNDEYNKLMSVIDEKYKIWKSCKLSYESYWSKTRNLK